MKCEINEDETIGDTLKKLPDVNEYLYKMFSHFVTLDNILLDKEASKVYHQLMLKVIAQYEFDRNNYKQNGLNYSLNKDWNDIKKEYGGTILLPHIK